MSIPALRSDFDASRLRQRARQTKNAPADPAASGAGGDL